MTSLSARTVPGGPRPRPAVGGERRRRPAEHHPGPEVEVQRRHALDHAEVAHPDADAGERQHRHGQGRQQAGRPRRRTPRRRRPSESYEGCQREGRRSLTPPPVTLRLMTEQDIPLLHEWLQRPPHRRMVGRRGGATEDARRNPGPLSSAGAGRGAGHALHRDAGRRGHRLCPVVRGAGQRRRLVGRRNRSRRPRHRPVAGPPRAARPRPRHAAGEGLVERLFADPEVSRIQTDPSPANLRAIRCYEKAGFRRLRTIVTPDGPAEYMVRERFVVA